MIAIEKYAGKVGIPTEILSGKSRKYRVASAREIYWLHLRQNGLSHVEIGVMFNRGRTTVIGGINTAKNLVSTKEEWALYCMNKLNGCTGEIF